MPDPEKLCVKELAAALQVSTKYVYQMRARGFEMQGVKRSCRTATVAAAEAWI
jgi:hypothetical protein